MSNENGRYLFMAITCRSLNLVWDWGECRLCQSNQIVVVAEPEESGHTLCLVCDEYFIRQKSQKNLINENSKQGLIDNLQSVCPANIEPSSYNQIHVASNPVYLLHNIIIISIRLARPLISADTSNNDGNSFAKILHRFAKLTEIDPRTTWVLATVWCYSVINSNLVLSQLVNTALPFSSALWSERYSEPDSRSPQSTKCPWSAL